LTSAQCHKRKSETYARGNLNLAQGRSDRAIFYVQSKLLLEEAQAL
jgi:hypothetical protein